METNCYATNYEIWHDESKKDGYYSGILLVPTNKKPQLVDLLKRIRREHGRACDADIKFAGCLRKPVFGRIVKNHLDLFSHIIQTNVKERTQFFNRSGIAVYKRDFSPFLEVGDSFGCRFGLLKARSLENTLDYFKSYRKKVETVFRFVMKGCCHSMFDDRSPIRLEKLYFDGEEQYEGEIDLTRLVKGDWRSYCDVKENMPIDARLMKDRHDETKLIMNFVDNVVGAWRALLNYEKDPNKVLYSLRPIYERLREKKIFKNPNSKWYKSISLSEFCIENGDIRFPDIFRNPDQQPLKI